MSSDQRNSESASVHLIVHPELQNLKITARLCESYNRLTTEAVAEYELLRQQVSNGELPDRVLKEAVLHIHNPKLKELMPAIHMKAPRLHAFVTTCQRLTFIENLLQGEITDEWLQKKRDQIFDTLTKAEMISPTLLDLLWKPYQQRPRKRPSAKAVRYLTALDFKNENRTTSWGQLATKFCGDSSQANTLKAWAYRTTKELAAIGISVRLDNPDYQ